MTHYTFERINTVAAGKYYEAARFFGGDARISKCDRYDNCTVNLWIEERYLKDVLNYVRYAR